MEKQRGKNMKRKNEQTVDVVKERERVYLENKANSFCCNIGIDFNKKTECKILLFKSLSFLRVLNKKEQAELFKVKDEYAWIN